jgi:hypothetical protein
MLLCLHLQDVEQHMPCLDVQLRTVRLYKPRVCRLNLKHAQVD